MNNKPRRTVIEMMTLGFTAVVIFYIVLASIVVAIVEVNDPTVNTEGIVNSITALITGILGALLGLIAGKAEGNGRQQ